MNPSGGFSNVRSGEINCMQEVQSLATIHFSDLVLIDQDSFDKTINYKIFSPHHDSEYQDGYASIRNILREMFSIRTVYSMVPKDKFDYLLFLRLDLFYHTALNLKHAIEVCGNTEGRAILTPSWQRWGGLNDRFAFAPTQCAEVYGHRLDAVPQYLAEVNEPLQAERMLLYTFMRKGVEYNHYLEMLASRVRGNKNIQPEFFDVGIDNVTNASRFSGIIKSLAA
ncbi:MAG: hypothetical protein HQM08_10145 [Candidatus Riflebacteria bacterium]|nr:hypothetical protein [Candidatus Riflebacteria bacterium]